VSAECHPYISNTQARLITRLPTLPKKLMPVDLVSIKRAVYALVALRNPSASLAHSASAFVDGGRAGAGTQVRLLVHRPVVTPVKTPVLFRSFCHSLCACSLVQQWTDMQGTAPRYTAHCTNDSAC
jgi:hypothetical protein